MRWVQLCGSLIILWHCLSLGLEWKLTFSSPVATAEFSKFAGILSPALSQLFWKLCLLIIWSIEFMAISTDWIFFCFGSHFPASLQIGNFILDVRYCEYYTVECLDFVVFKEYATLFFFFFIPLFLMCSPSWNMWNVMYETRCQSRFNARCWMLGAGALGRPWGMVWGGRREEGSTLFW